MLRRLPTKYVTIFANRSTKAHEELQTTVRELQDRVDELERFRKATVQREFRIKELKEEIERLKKSHEA